MKSFCPSFETATELGYHPVGIKPKTFDSRASAMSMTATSLLSAFATYRRLPSGDRASASGVEPTGSLGSSDVFTVSITLPPRITLTLFDPELATYKRPSLPNSNSLGWLPTLIVATGWSVFDSRKLTDSSPQFDTASNLPSGDSTAA